MFTGAPSKFCPLPNLPYDVISPPHHRLIFNNSRLRKKDYKKFCFVVKGRRALLNRAFTKHKSNVHGWTWFLQFTLVAANL